MLSQETFDVLLSVAMLVVIALVWGGIFLLRRGTDRKRAVLMLLAALVLLGNILIWTWPS
ncbi:MAG: hypothetical protein IPN48_00715 [Sphingomonadales bacterium]|nr:hypothetical protein [Sphingomonadales bacterium]MBL0114210.1 hypothetical protein [Sphingomonadales bacterium]